MNGAALLEQVKKGLFFQTPMDHHTRFGLEASMIEDAEGKVSIDPVEGWHARWQVLGQMTDRLIAEKPDLFRVLERLAHAFVTGTQTSTARTPPRRRGRPKSPENDVEAITARLRGLKTDDDARRYLRQAFSTCATGASAQARRARGKGAAPDEDELEDTHRAAFLVLREELDRLGCGLRVPRLSNVLMLLLDEEGCDRRVLAKAAADADVLKTGGHPRKNLADHLGATRKELADLKRLCSAFARHIEECAWWPLGSSV